MTILLVNISTTMDILLIAQKILSTLELAYVIDNNEFTVTGSIGIGIYPHDDTGAEGLLRKADIAMYRAKEMRGNNFRLSELIGSFSFGFFRACLSKEMHKKFFISWR